MCPKMAGLRLKPVHQTPEPTTLPMTQWGAHSDALSWTCSALVALGQHGEQAAARVGPSGLRAHGLGKAGWSGAGRGPTPLGARLSSPPPAAPPGRAPCPLLPKPRGFLFLLPRAVSCLSFELGCWLPLTSLLRRHPSTSSDGLVPPGCALEKGGTGGPRGLRFLEALSPSFTLLALRSGCCLDSPLPSSLPITLRGGSSVLRQQQGTPWMPLSLSSFQPYMGTLRSREVLGHAQGSQQRRD